MPTRKNYILKTLSVLAMLNLLWLIYLIFTTNPDYTIVPVNSFYSVLILFYFPFVLAASSILVFLFDLVRHKEKNWFAFFPAFIALLPYALFIIGSLWFLGK